MSVNQISVKVIQVDHVGDEIVAYSLERIDGGLLPIFTPGAHIDLFLENGMVRQYSLCNETNDAKRYRIAVFRDPKSRGGSEFIHQYLLGESIVKIGEPRNNFKLDETAENYLLIAGGIGITPLFSMAHELRRLGKQFELYYLCRGPKQAAFRYELEMGFGENVKFHFSDKEESRLDLGSILEKISSPTQVYTCGPEGLIQSIIDAGEKNSNITVRCERFAVVSSDIEKTSTPFNVRIASTGELIHVGEKVSVLHALRDKGFTINSLCEEGICGSCCVGMLNGQADHRDFVLTEVEKNEQTMLMVCCSRAKSEEITLDL